MRDIRPFRPALSIAFTLTGYLFNALLE